MSVDGLWLAVNEPNDTDSRKPALREIGRLAQLMRASGVLEGSKR